MLNVLTLVDTSLGIVCVTRNILVFVSRNEQYVHLAILVSMPSSFKYNLVGLEPFSLKIFTHVSTYLEILPCYLNSLIWYRTASRIFELRNNVIYIEIMFYSDHDALKTSFRSRQAIAVNTPAWYPV